PICGGGVSRAGRLRWPADLRLHNGTKVLRKPFLVAINADTHERGVPQLLPQLGVVVELRTTRGESFGRVTDQQFPAALPTQLTGQQRRRDDRQSAGGRFL